MKEMIAARNADKQQEYGAYMTEGHQKDRDAQKDKDVPIFDESRRCT
jgi:hypothetical protein